MYGLLARARSFWRGVRRPAQTSTEMDEEMRFHIEMEAERLVGERGLTVNEARRQAAIAFGGVEKRKEEGRDVRGLTLASGLSLDLKLAWRMLVKSPGLTMVAGLGMAFAIAVGVGVFIVLQEFLYPKLPLDEGDRIIALENWDVAAANEWRHAVHDFVIWREEMRSVEQISAFSRTSVDLVDGDSPPLSVRTARITASGFDVARVAPLLGRYLVESDERPGAPHVAVIGYDLWQTSFNGDPKVLGREVLLGDSVHTIVGVMPEGYRFPWYFNLWMPLRVDPSRYERGEGPELFVFGRLAPGRRWSRRARSWR
jgi:putative ABC transport system permease protein